MARVGFCINGFNRDQRDFFPFEFVDVDPIAYPLYPAGFNFVTAFEFIHRAKEWQPVIDITVFDDTASIPGDTNLLWGQLIQRVFSGNELHIQKDYLTNFAWPAYVYNTASFDPFYGNASVNLGSGTEIPMRYLAENSFAPYLIVDISIEGGDVGDRSTIAQLKSNPPDLIDWAVSAVDCTFMGRPFLLYERQSAPYDHPASGTIVIPATGFWSYDGVWDTSDGSQLITPVPLGF